MPRCLIDKEVYCKRVNPLAGSLSYWKRIILTRVLKPQEVFIFWSVKSILVAPATLTIRNSQGKSSIHWPVIFFSQALTPDLLYKEFY